MPEIGYEYPTGKIKNQQGFPLLIFHYTLYHAPYITRYMKHIIFPHFSSLFITCSKAFSA